MELGAFLGFISASLGYCDETLKSTQVSPPAPELVLAVPAGSAAAPLPPLMVPSSAAVSGLSSSPPTLTDSLPDSHYAIFGGNHKGLFVRSWKLVAFIQVLCLLLLLLLSNPSSLQPPVDDGLAPASLLPPALVEVVGTPPSSCMQKDSDNVGTSVSPGVPPVLEEGVGGDLLSQEWILAPSSWVVLPVNGVDIPYTLGEDGSTHSRWVNSVKLCWRSSVSGGPAWNFCL